MMMMMMIHVFMDVDQMYTLHHDMHGQIGNRTYVFETTLKRDPCSSCYKLLFF